MGSVDPYACIECKHHPAREIGSCKCECHQMALQLVEGGISEERNALASTPRMICRFGAAMRLQSDAKTRLKRLTKHMKNQRSA